MSLRTPARLIIRMTVFVLAWTGALYAWPMGTHVLDLAFAGIPFAMVLWLMLLLDLVLAFMDRGRWHGFPAEGKAYSPEDLSRIRQMDRRFVIRVVLLWALLLCGGIALIAWTPLGPDAAVLAVASLLPVEAVFVRWRCPFRWLLTHSRCCRTCRLRDWGEAMVLSPLLVVPSMIPAGLFVLSVILLLRGELFRRSRPYLLDIKAAGYCCATCADTCTHR